MKGHAAFVDDHFDYFWYRRKKQAKGSRLITRYSSLLVLEIVVYWTQ